MTRFDEADYTLGFEHTSLDGPGTGDVRGLLGVGSCPLPMSTSLPSMTSGRRDGVQPGSASAGPSLDERFYTGLGTVAEAAIEGIFARAACLGCSHRSHDAYECRVTPYFATPGERCRCNLQDGMWPE